MKRYSKIIFLCTGNTYLSPLAEAMYRQYTAGMEGMPECCSRGLVVLFSEPISPKVNVSLSQHDMQPGGHESSVQLSPEDVEEDTLCLTMTFSEKVAFLENYQTENVYTLGEFVGEDTDIVDPYGGEEEQYAQCFEHIAGRVRKVIDILSVEKLFESDEDEEKL